MISPFSNWSFGTMNKCHHLVPSIMQQSYNGEEELCCVYVPTNHLYIGDVFLVNSNDVIRPNLSVREGIGKLQSYFSCLKFPSIISLYKTATLESSGSDLSARPF